MKVICPRCGYSEDIVGVAIGDIVQCSCGYDYTVGTSATTNNTRKNSPARSPIHRPIQTETNRRSPEQIMNTMKNILGILAITILPIAFGIYMTMKENEVQETFPFESSTEFVDGKWYEYKGYSQAQYSRNEPALCVESIQKNPEGALVRLSRPGRRNYGPIYFIDMSTTRISEDTLLKSYMILKANGTYSFMNDQGIQVTVRAFKKLD